MTVKLLTFEAPYGCRWCGDERHHHGEQWAPIIGLHSWLEPSQAMILERMTRRRAHRLAADPPKYHVATGWDVASDGESADPYCKDCGDPACWRWERIQARLDRQRWQLSGMPHGASPLGSWGGEPPW